MGSGLGQRNVVDRRRPRGRACALIAVSSLVLCACHYHLGRPPSAGGLVIGAVEAPVAEPGLPEVLEVALAAAIRQRGAQGARLVQARVLRAELSPDAARGGEIQAWRATLEVRFELLGPAPWVLVLRREEVVPAAGMGAAGLPATRAAAFADLARVLAEEAVDSYLYAPPGGAGEP